jgi:hypothetical protein
MASPFLQLHDGFMGIQVQFLLSKPDNIHGASIALGAKAGADILLFAELQAGSFIIMERA